MGVVMLTERAIVFLFYSMLWIGSKDIVPAKVRAMDRNREVVTQRGSHAVLESMGLAPIATPQLFYNRYKNRDSDEKEGQPNSVGLLVSALLSDWCGGGDLNPYALRR